VDAARLVAREEIEREEIELLGHRPRIAKQREHQERVAGEVVSSKKGDRMSKTLAKLGEGGRLVIPAEYRKALGLQTGDEVILLLEEGSVRVLTPREAVRRAQAIVRKYIPPGTDLVNDLIADRRREAESD